MVERAEPFAAPVSGQRSGITISSPARGSVWQIACWPGSFAEVEAALATACGCEAPAPGQVVETVDGALLVRVEPLKWWVIGADGAECPHRPSPEQGSSLDLSHDQAVVAVEGADAPEMMKRLVSLDLREAAFPDRSFATTGLHHMIVRVLRRDGAAPRYELWVMRSYADTLREVVAETLDLFAG